MKLLRYTISYADDPESDIEDWGTMEELAGRHSNVAILLPFITGEPGDWKLEFTSVDYLATITLATWGEG